MECYDGHPFNSLEPDLCKLAFISKVQMICGGVDVESAAQQTLIELPNCPVCLERINESTVGTLVSTSCNHVFHSDCMQKMTDARCPVCRYLMRPTEQGNKCSKCNASDDLWLCLICGHIGCGRYGGKHAYRHFLETGHAYSMDIDSQRVWDYVGDNFVHRLIEISTGTGNSKGSGMKPLGVQSRPRGENEQDLDHEEKIDAVQLEYTHLMNVQLESQRKYFEGLLQQQEIELRKDFDRRMSIDSNQSAKLKQLEKANDTMKKQWEEEQELSAAMRSNRALLEQRYGILQKVTEGRRTNLLELGKKNTVLENTIAAHTNTISKLQETVASLREEARDLMFYMEARDKIDKEVESEEIQGLDVTFSPSKPR